MLQLPPFLTAGFGEGPRSPVARRMPPATVSVVPMCPGRVPAVASLDRACFKAPWAERDFHRSISGTTGRYGIVALHGPHARVVGFAIAAVDEVEKVARVLRFATDENLRRRRVASAIFGQILDDAALDGQRSVECPIPETDAAARRFLQSLGFRGKSKGGVIAGYYGNLDAFVLAKPTGVCVGK